MLDFSIDPFLVPFEADKLLEIRTAPMKLMPGLTVSSGIDKKLCGRPMKIDKLGLEGDEHDPTFHGGPDKAILGYCSSHYPNWQATFPERADRFVPGAFGENFVTSHMNERNVCIGDVISFGPEVVLQVSLPRSPCFKLNHRFELKKFAPITNETSRTGWYYRVLREGTVNVGDEIRLVERKYPKWTIDRIQEYLHRHKDNYEMNKELAQIEELGDEARGQFKRRVAKAAAKKVETKEEVWVDYKIISRSVETPRIISLVFEVADPKIQVEDINPAAHARLRLPIGLTRSYSIVSNHEEKRGRFQLGIALEENSRGGSRYLHEIAKVGDTIPVGNITTSVGRVMSASMHTLIVGGIGITAFLPLLDWYLAANFDFKLHYAVRSADDIPFRDRLESLMHRVVIYDKSKGERMNVDEIVKNIPWNNYLYVCGPDRLMKAAKSAVAEHNVPSNEVHFEAFSADTTGDPFEVEVANRGNKVLKVGEEETLLDVLRRDIEDFPSSCEVGNCGTCKVSLKCGEVEHRGTALTEEEKGEALLSCVSRGRGKITIEI